MKEIIIQLLPQLIQGFESGREVPIPLTLMRYVCCSCIIVIDVAAWRVSCDVSLEDSVSCFSPQSLTAVDVKSREITLRFSVMPTTPSDNKEH